MLFVVNYAPIVIYSVPEKKEFVMIMIDFVVTIVENNMQNINVVRKTHQIIQSDCASAKYVIIEYLVPLPDNETSIFFVCACNICLCFLL